MPGKTERVTATKIQIRHVTLISLADAYSRSV